MRVITGKARGVSLKTPEGMLTRPTADRVKEALFSIIHFDIPGARVLDLFGGTGQLGIEALSQGAAQAVFVDAGSAFEGKTPDMHLGVGVGLRWRSPVGPVRIDIARGLKSPDSPFTLHLNIGADL